MIELDLSDDGRLIPEKVFEEGISEKRIELLVHVRRAEDIDLLVKENNKLQDKIKQQDRDIRQWAMMHSQYMHALDEIRTFKRYCKKHHIDFDFSSV